MAIFVINEWLWADASGENGIDAQRQAFQFTTKLSASEDQIVVIEGSRFDQKTWNICKSNNTDAKRLVKTYLANVRLNSDRCLLLKLSAVAKIPHELASSTNPDDHYLIHAQLSVLGATIVTTDTDLHDAVMNAGLPCLFRNEFVTKYLAT